MSAELPEMLASEEEVGGSSLMERLREKHRQLLETTTIDLPIPGYGGDLVARYRILELDEQAEIGKRAKRQFKKQEERIFASSLDGLITACEGFFTPEQDSGELKAIEPDGQILTYDNRLASFLGYEAGSAREVVMGLFNNNESAIIQHYVKLQRWMSDTDFDATESMLGE